MNAYKKSHGVTHGLFFLYCAYYPWEGFTILTHGSFQTLIKRCRGQAYVIARHHQLNKYLLPTKIINKTLPT
jgi:hypothetical protein